jgi:hypothetical protein
MYIRIYKEKKSATQSYSGGTKWILETESSVKTQYSSDVNHNGIYIKLKFDRYESAVAYAQSNNMHVINDEKSSSTKRSKKNYLKNFQT